MFPWFKRRKFPFSGRSVTYVLRDDFTTEDLAPVTSPRTCEPGPGTLTFVDTGNYQNIAGGKLYKTARQAALNPRWYSGTLTRAQGLACGFTYDQNANFGEEAFGWFSNTSGALDNTFRVTAEVGRVRYVGDNNKLAFPRLCYFTSGSHKFYVVLRTAGAYYIIDDRIIHISHVTTTASPRVGSAAENAGSYGGLFDTARAMQLGAPWTDDANIYTAKLATVNAGDTLTGTSTPMVDFQWTFVTGQTLDMMVRRTDDDNCWIFRSNGTTHKIIQKQAGTETERASAAGTLTNGTKYQFRCYFAPTGSGSNERMDGMVHNVTTGEYVTFGVGYTTTLTFNQSATGIKVNQAGDNLIAWPTVISAAAQVELQKYES